MIYAEVSSKLRINVDEVFYSAVREYRRRHSKEGKKRELERRLRTKSGASTLLPWNVLERAKCAVSRSQVLTHGSFQ